MPIDLDLIPYLQMPTLHREMIACQQHALLNSFAPHFTKALEQGKKEIFFEKLYTIWFDLYPEIGDGDPEYEDWLLKRRKRVRVHYIIRVLTPLIPFV
jgi:hypothetical protein